MKTKKPEPPRIQEMRILKGYRNERAEFKKTYFAVPKGGGVGFCAIPAALMESEVWGALGIYERRFVDAIQITHVRTGGCNNGRLTLMHEQLKERRIRGNRIKPVIRKLVALNLLEVTHEGGPADPARYRVTFLPHRIDEPNGRVAFYPPGNEWIEIELEVIEGSRVAREKRHKPPQRPAAKKTDFQGVHKSTCARVHMCTCGRNGNAQLVSTPMTDS